MLKVGVLVSGGGTNLQALIDKRDETYKIVAVLSSKKSAYAVTRAKNHGLHHKILLKKNFVKAGAYEKAIIKYFESRGVELVVTAGFLTVLDESFIHKYENRIINIHPSLVPHFCGKGFYGLKVHEAVLAAGVKVTGATVQFVVTETDAGPIILQKAVDVLDGDTPETLQRRVMEEAEWVILPQAVKLFAQGLIK
jgi:phosphoribosylglycinamide formyltransferase-1